MPQASVSGTRQAVLKNLQNGEHIWMCIAANELGTTNITVEFTGELCNILNSLI